MDNTIHNHLQPGEEILWEGQSLQQSRITLNKSGILWLSFSVLWTIMAIIMASFIKTADSTGMFFKLAFPLFGLPFVAIGIFMVFIIPAKQQKKDSSTYYYVTNKRIIINIDTVKAQVFNSIPIKNLNSVHLTENQDTTCNIMFSPSILSNNYAYPSVSSSKNSFAEPTVNNCFYRIESGIDVHKLILMQQKLVDLNDNN